MQAALVKAGNDLKSRELDMKERLSDAQIKKLIAEQVQVGVQAAYSAMQGGAQVAQMPMIAPIADAIMKSAGYQVPTPGGQDPNYPIPGQVAATNIQATNIRGHGPEGEMAEVRKNTSPSFPPVAGEPGAGMRGIETQTPADNLGAPV